MERLLLMYISDLYGRTHKSGTDFTAVRYRFETTILLCSVLAGYPEESLGRDGD